MAKAADVYFQVDPWRVIEQGFDPAYARVSESIFSLGNESIGVRGCFDEGGHVDSLRGAYTNGIYDMEKLSRSYKGIIDKTHFMIPSAEWLMTTISVDGETLDLGQSQFSDFTRELDLRAGTLTRRFLWTTKSGKQIRLTFLRFLDMVHANARTSASRSKRSISRAARQSRPACPSTSCMKGGRSVSGRRRASTRSRIA